MQVRKLEVSCNATLARTVHLTMSIYVGVCLCLRTWCELDTKPDRHRHAAVMDDMQRCYLTRLLAQHKEDLQKANNKHNYIQSLTHFW